MRFEDVLGNGRLWAVVYDGEEADALSLLFQQWNDVTWLRSFFENNLSDLKSYFKITDINRAVYDTLEDAEDLACLIFDWNPEARLGQLFRYLENSRTYEMLLGREKAKGERISGHASWLRIYAIRLEEDTYLVTGGAIKLTKLMEERTHTLSELGKMEKVRNYLLSQGAHDLDSFEEMIKEDSDD